jgi:hypothetical protein
VGVRVWRLSRRIRQEHENACDDLDVSFCGEAIALLQALAKLEGLRTPAHVPSLSPSAQEMEVH